MNTSLFGGELAVRCRKLSREINPNNAKAYLNRGVINYYHFDNIFQAKKDLNKAAELFLEQGDTRSYQRVRKILQEF